MDLVKLGKVVGRIPDVTVVDGGTEVVVGRAFVRLT